MKQENPQPSIVSDGSKRLKRMIEQENQPAQSSWISKIRSFCQRDIIPFPSAKTDSSSMNSENKVKKYPQKALFYRSKFSPTII